MSARLVYLSLGTTRGLRVADAALIAQLERAGASVRRVGVRIGALDRLRRGYPANDLVEALAARRALARALARGPWPDALVISTVTAAFLAPRLEMPWAIRFDSPAVLNRPGALNRPLHSLERRAVARARLLVPFSEAALRPLAELGTPAVVVSPPIVARAPGGERDRRLAVAYTPDPKAKGLDLLRAAWERVETAGARLELYGIDPERVGTVPSGMVVRDSVPAAEFRAALGRAWAFVSAARWEDYGQAPLEALADGALLVTAPAGGAYEALRLARLLDTRLVASDMSPAALARAIDTAFGLAAEEAGRLRSRAGDLLEAYQPEALERTVARELLPALLG